MLRIVRRLGLGSREAPSIPGMQVVEWRMVELKTGKAIIALCHKDSVLYVASYQDELPPNSSQLTESSSIAELTTELRLNSVNLTHLYPAYTAQFALYLPKSGKLKGDVFVKRARVLDLVAAKGVSAIHTPCLAKITAHEASICERLAAYPHPNIAEYLGVQVRDSLSFLYQGNRINVPLTRNSVFGLVFRRYDCTLHELVTRRHKFNVKSCLRAVAAGLEHLHRKGIVHGDVQPHNVYVKRGDRDHFVIGDFACAQNVGGVVLLKTGNARWGKKKKIGVDRAEKDDDWYGYRKLVEWLEGEVGDRLDAYKGFGNA